MKWRIMVGSKILVRHFDRTQHGCSTLVDLCNGSEYWRDQLSCLQHVLEHRSNSHR